MNIKKGSVKRYLLFGAFMAMAVLFTACQILDVIGNGSASSLGEIIEAMPEEVAETETLWSLSAPDGTASFNWSRDFRETDYDAFLKVDAQPFVDAGLDTDALPEEVLIENGQLVFGMDFGTNEYEYEGEITAVASYEQFVFLKRTHISHHAAADHYGIDLGGGHKFEWARDMKDNDKDIVFVLDPEILTDAGVNPEQVEGWLYTTVETMGMNGKAVEVEKFLKPFDIK